MPQSDTATTFVSNMRLPIHRWYRYTAGFSAQWAEEVIKSECRDSGNNGFTVLDPFAGSGTTMLAADQAGVPSVGFESQPLVNKIATAKLAWDTDPSKFVQKALNVEKLAASIDEATYDYPSIVKRCYDERNLIHIDRLRKALERVKDDTPEYKLAWLAFVCILRPSSRAGTATWQYVLPNNSKSKVINAAVAYHQQINMMAEDLKTFQSQSVTKLSRIIDQDARVHIDSMDDQIDLVVTSPPYANNYDYADATRLELSVLGDIEGWGDLQDLIRPGLVRSCSQMVSKETAQTFDYLRDPLLSPIYDEITDVCKKMQQERENHGGKKNYFTMIALYFLDLAHVMANLRAYCREDARMCFVVGDSAPYGVYVPVDRWLGVLAQSVGFGTFTFTKTRDRNVKWKNRKHRVPLKEGYLWIEG